MIYLALFFEFFKIGLFAIGGGAATIPFLFNLTEKYPWFTPLQLTNMIAVSESTPGPIGVNMATFAGFHAAGIIGGFVATIGLVTPSVIIIILLSKILKKYACNTVVKTVLSSIHPGVLALILFACWQIARVSICDLKSFLVFALLLVLMCFFKKGPIFYIFLSAVVGIILQL